MNIKFGITGSISSGKTTAGKIISKGTGPIFSADLAVNNLYKNYSLKKRLAKKLKIKVNSKFKKELKIKILSKKGNLKMLEKMIHPLVRKKMFIFLKKNKEKKFVILDIPLLLENKINKKKDILIFIHSKKSDVLKKLRKRKNFNQKLINQFSKIQLSLDYKKKKSKFIIKNDFTKKTVEKYVKYILKHI